MIKKNIFIKIRKSLNIINVFIFSMVITSSFIITTTHSLKAETEESDDTDSEDTDSADGSGSEGTSGADDADSKETISGDGKAGKYNATNFNATSAVSGGIGAAANVTGVVTGTMSKKKLSQFQSEVKICLKGIQYNSLKRITLDKRIPRKRVSDDDPLMQKSYQEIVEMNRNLIKRTMGPINSCKIKGDDINAIKGLLTGGQVGNVAGAVGSGASMFGGTVGLVGGIVGAVGSAASTATNAVSIGKLNKLLESLGICLDGLNQIRSIINGEVNPNVRSVAVGVAGARATSVQGIAMPQRIQYSNP